MVSSGKLSIMPQLTVLYAIASILTVHAIACIYANSNLPTERKLTSLILVSHHLCPYVQRAAISLAEKAVGFNRIYVDLANKPDWFKALSPLGKVPLLRVANGRGRP